MKNYPLKDRDAERRFAFLNTFGDLDPRNSRRKAFETRTSHLILVAPFFVPFYGTYIIAWANVNIDTDTRIVNTSLSASLPPAAALLHHLLPEGKGANAQPAEQPWVRALVRFP
ncbi:olfactory receptor 1361-like [Arapaima gigas]